MSPLPRPQVKAFGQSISALQRQFITLLLVGGGAIIAWTAHSHLGAPSLAPLTGPVGTGLLVDTEFEIAWVDYDMPIATGTATVDLFYTANNPPPYYGGEIPENLQGTPVVRGILEKDTNNRYLWNTSTVAPGSYWLWSRVNEPPGELNSGLTFIEFSPGVITIAHPGDPVNPAIMITRPNTPVAIATDSYRIEFSSFDPDQSGRVTIEAAPPESQDYEIIFDDVVTSSIGQFMWNTSQLSDGDWKLRAGITDNRGRSFLAYSRYFVTVSHLLVPDAGLDAGTAFPPSDSGISPVRSLDSGVTAQTPPIRDETCSCRDTEPNESPRLNVLLLMLILGISLGCCRVT